MFLKKFLLFGLMAAVLPAFAEEAADRKTATSLKYVEHELDTRQNKFTAEQNKAMEYTNTAGAVEKRAVKSDLGTNTSDTSLPMVGGVNTKLATKQDDIAPINDHTAVTYTGTTGKIGAKGIYQTSESYVEQSNNLIDAKTFNAALKKGLDSEFLCSEYKPGTDLCWVWSIHNNGDDALPNDYTQLEWIQSTGTQYIDTGITGNINTGIEVKGSNFTEQSAQIVVASTTGNTMMRVAKFTATAKIGGTVGAQTLTSSADGVDEFVVALKNRSVYVNNQFIGTVNNPTFNQSELGNILIFKGCYRNNACYLAKGKIYYVRLYDGDNLVRNFIPARQNSDNKVGMYDTVSGEFFENNGTGVFQAGPEKDAPYTTLVPAGYTPVEYIISNGTQYFDSGRKATDKSEVSVTVMATIEDAARSRLIGNFADFSKAFTINMSTREGVSRFGNQSAINTPMPINSKHVYSNGAGGLRMDGNVLHAWSTQPAFETLGNVALLASTNTTTTVPSNLTNGLAGNTYNITWHEDGVLVMNLIPARRNQDSVVGMYDTVSGTFFENAGTGVFQAGPDINNIIYVPQNQ